jgi:hypothetical protein
MGWNNLGDPSPPNRREGFYKAIREFKWVIKIRNIMKTFILILYTSFATLGYSNGQSLSEWFSQKSTELEYYADQISAYQVYASWLEKGYGIAQKGLTLIGDLKKGEFDLQQGFYSSLEMVNPAIGNYSKITDIISWQISIFRNFPSILQVKNLSSGGLDYLNRVCSNLERGCINALNDLIGVLADNGFEMMDDERIKRIDRIWQDMKDKYAFSQSFRKASCLLANQRSNESNEISALKNILE